MSSSCAMSGSVTMPWQPAVTPAQQRLSSPSSYPPTTCSRHAPPARRLYVDARSGGTCERLSTTLSWPPQLGQRRGNGGDGCQRDGVERHWDDWYRSSLEGAHCSDESAMVRLPNRCSANGLPTFSLHRLLPISIDQLDKADAPLISKTYIYLLGVQYLVSLSDGLTGYSFHLYNTVAVQNPPTGSTEPVRVLCPLDPMTLPEAEPARTGLQTVRAMLNAG